MQRSSAKRLTEIEKQIVWAANFIQRDGGDEEIKRQFKEVLKNLCEGAMELDSAIAKVTYSRLVFADPASSHDELNKAYGLLKDAANRQNDKAALYHLARLFEGTSTAKRLGITPDKYRSIQYYIKAAEAGSGRAREFLSLLYYEVKNAKNNEEIIKEFQSDGNALFEFAKILLTNKTIGICDTATATSIIEVAAHLGSSSALQYIKESHRNSSTMCGPVKVEDSPPSSPSTKVMMSRLPSFKRAVIVKETSNPLPEAPILTDKEREDIENDVAAIAVSTFCFMM